MLKILYFSFCRLAAARNQYVGFGLMAPIETKKEVPQMMGMSAVTPPTVLFPSSPLWPMSTGPKCLSLAKYHSKSTVGILPTLVQTERFDDWKGV
jgi:hypothetical protein